MVIIRNSYNFRSPVLLVVYLGKLDMLHARSRLYSLKVNNMWAIA